MSTVLKTEVFGILQKRGILLGAGKVFLTLREEVHLSGRI